MICDARRRWVTMGPYLRGIVLIAPSILIALFMVSLIYIPINEASVVGPSDAAALCIGFGIFNIILAVVIVVTGLVVCFDPCSIGWLMPLGDTYY